MKMLLYLTLLLIVSCIVFVACSPQLGAISNGNRTMTSANHTDGRFRNTIPTSVSSSSKDMFGSMLEYFWGGQNREPGNVIPTQKVNAGLIGNSEHLRVTWLGHSTCLIEIDGKVVLTDPIFNGRPSPVPFLGPKRFASDLPIEVENLPKIDIVLISHDHYDHLDLESIRLLKDKTERFYVPLGVGAHLKRWGVSTEKVTELDWWQKDSFDGLTLVAAPTRHFSGRLFTRNKTLWASWVVIGEKQRVYFGGDSGYTSEFKKIGDKYGPFDLTMLESGAYNEAWSQIHMMPEETVQAHIDLKGELLLPIHWAKFNLSLHSWTEPIERLLAAAEVQEIAVTAPLQGQSVVPGEQQPLKRWWEEGLPEEEVVVNYSKE